MTTWKELERSATGQSLNIATRAVRNAIEALPEDASSEAIAILAAALVPHLQSRYDAKDAFRSRDRDGTGRKPIIRDCDPASPDGHTPTPNIGEHSDDLHDYVCLDCGVFVTREGLRHGVQSPWHGPPRVAGPNDYA